MGAIKLNKYIKTITALIITVFILHTLAVNPMPLHAADITLTMSLSNTSPKPGDTVTLQVKFSSPMDIFGVQSVIEYNNTILDYEGYDYDNLNATARCILEPESEKSRQILFESDTGIKNATMCRIRFKVKAEVQSGQTTAFSFIKTSDLPKGTNSEFNTIRSDAFSLQGISLTVIVPTPTPKPTNTPVKETQTPPVKTNTPEITETPPVTGENTPEVTLTPGITETMTSVPTLTPKTPLTTDKGANDDKIDTWAYVFWAIACLFAGIWIGIGVGYMIWGKSNKRSMYRFRR